MPELRVYKNRTNVIQVDLGMDVSGDTITSEIRAEKSFESELLATWTVDFLTDGTDGVLVLTLDDSDLDSIVGNKGWMDMKRTSGGEPLPVFSNPLRVRFVEAVVS